MPTDAFFRSLQDGDDYLLPVPSSSSVKLQIAKKHVESLGNCEGTSQTRKQDSFLWLPPIEALSAQEAI